MAMPDRGSTRDLSSLRLDPAEKRPSRSRWQVLLFLLGIPGVLLIALAIATIAPDPSSSEPGSAPPQSKNSDRPDPPLIPRPARNAVAAGGYVEARRSAVLRPGRDGVVAAVHVTLGQHVTEGGLLLELENGADVATEEMAAAELELAKTRLKAVRAGSRIEEVQVAGSEVAAAEASYAEARQDLTRFESLAPQGAVTAAEVDRARQQTRAAEARLEALRARERMVRRGNLPTDVAAARAQEERAAASLRQATAQLELTRLRAPFSGTIVALDVEPGEVVSVQSPREIMTLADLSELWVRVDVPEGRITKVSMGSPAEVVIDALGEERLRAEVVEIAPLADRQSNTLSVAVRMLDERQQLRPNMSARVFIRPNEEGGSPP